MRAEGGGEARTPSVEAPSGTEPGPLAVADGQAFADKETSDALYTALLKLAATAIVALDADGRIVSWPPQAEEIAGYSASELVGRRLSVWHTPDIVAADAADRTLRAATVGGHVDLDGWRVRKDGAWIWVHQVASARWGPDGKVAGFTVVIQDLTLQRRATEALRANEARFRALIEHAPDLILVLATDATVRYASPSVERVLGYEAGVLLARRILDYVHPEDVGAAERALADCVRAGATATFEVRFRHEDGSYRILQGVGRDLRDNPGVGGIVANLRNVTARRHAEDALRESEERFRLLVEGSAAILFYVLDLEGCLTYVSPAVRSVTGYAPEELLGRPYTVLGSRGLDDPDAARQHIAARIAERLRTGDAPVRLATQVRHRDGHAISLELVECVVRAGGAVVGIHGYARDVTPQQRLEEQLRHAALHDALTGLPNRALFDDRLTHAAALQRRHATRHFAVLLVDLDRFKLVNDSIGHAVGDRLLVEVARRLERCMQPGDTVARYGGDEFALLVDEIEGPGAAERVADAVARALSAPFVLAQHEVFTSASIGTALSSTGYADPAELVRSADIALYRAKAYGRGRHEVYDQAMHESAVGRLQLETGLRRAIERDEFHVAYQPIVSLATGRVAAFEALARWSHASLGPVGPGEFVPIAEDTGGIVGIDLWMLGQSCRQLAAWQRQHPRWPLAMSVNLSGKLLALPDLADRVAAAIAEAGVAAGSVRLEVTETVLIERTSAARSALAALRDLGVVLVLDDFGTGYSSLGYLNQFPFDALKIDRSLVRDDGASAKIMQAVVALAHGLGLAVVAEGVETEVQLTRVRAIGCEYAQGYHLSQPIDGESAAELLNRDPRW